jgi:hypothetical protein
LKEKKEYLVHYKNITLKHKFYADFVVLTKSILGKKSE